MFLTCLFEKLTHWVQGLKDLLACTTAGRPDSWTTSIKNWHIEITFCCDDVVTFTQLMGSINKFSMYAFNISNQKLSEVKKQQYFWLMRF